MSKKKTKKKRKKRVQKSVKTKKYVRGSLIKSIYAYFDDVGVDEATYIETYKLAKSIKPDTAFNKYHFSWYKNDYKNKRDLP